MERARVLRERLRDPEWVKELPSRGAGDVQNEITRLTGKANKLADVLVLNKYELWDKASERKQMTRELGPRNVD
jgi:G3E family GTPase